jgi:uncharacterized membrane protein YedE/YeeE
MPKKSATEVTLDVICREIKELKEGQKELRADINRGKGAIWLLLVISGMVAGFLGYFRKLILEYPVSCTICLVWQFILTKKWNGLMFNNPFKLPTYSEWKESVEKINADVMKFWKDWFNDIKKTLDK